MVEDLGLLEAWRAGEDSAGQALIERYFDAVRRFFVNKAGVEADDLVQRTFLAIAGGKEAYRGTGTFRSFVFGIARNVLFEHIREHGRDRRQEPDFSLSAIADLNPGVATLAAQRADQELVARALQQVPLELQLILELYYWEDLSVAELSGVLEVPAGTVKSRLHRARHALREAIERLPASEEQRASALFLLGDAAEDR